MSLILLIALFIYLTLRTGTTFVSLVATTVIMFSFQITLILTREILYVNNLPALYIVVLYYIQAIMADPVVTFVENWKKSS